MAEILTNNAMFSSFMIVLIVFALGDIVGKITKGKLSGMMVVMLLFLVGFLTKLIPADIIDQGRPYGVIKTGNCDGTVQHGYYPERETADRGVENRINGGTLYAGVLPCDASGIPDHRI